MMLPPEFLLAKLKGHGSPKDSATYRTYEGRSGTLEKTVDAPAFVEDWPVNLLEISIDSVSNYDNSGLNFEVNKTSGTVKISGVANKNVAVTISSIDIRSSLKNGKTYYLSGGINYNNVVLSLIQLRSPWTHYIDDYGDGASGIYTNSSVEVCASITVPANTDFTIPAIFRPCLIEGSQPRGFIPYEGGEVKTCGKNLLEIAAESQTINGITFTVDKEAGTITANGQENSERGYTELVIKSDMLETISNKNLYFSGCPINGNSDNTYCIILRFENPRMYEFDIGNGFFISAELASRLDRIIIGNL